MATQNYIDKQGSLLSDLQSDLLKLKKEKKDSVLQNSLENLTEELRNQIDNKEILELKLIQIKENLKKADID